MNASQKGSNPTKAAGQPAASDESAPTNAAQQDNGNDDYDDSEYTNDTANAYDDWDLAGNSKTAKQSEKRGGGNGSGSIYSAKHTRMRAARK
eukprot:CAMPEP_0172448206 /NCGR_PEP_ID=MMETSP1065-20121228/7267_1 /TAXON_ID=265537 /ORGANISM="Amphiprora paludosa, Strain CCMP125" /LENGTH=91 /DNA_ID=CAMNT_0013199633 /DNA_START=69 /DNA_END=344 /DNA_ORIENTATION=+